MNTKTEQNAVGAIVRAAFVVDATVIAGMPKLKVIVGLDVFDPELAIHHPIFEHQNVVLTPHVMGLSAKATVATYKDAAQGVRDVIDGRKPRAVVNLKSDGSK